MQGRPDNCAAGPSFTWCDVDSSSEEEQVSLQLLVLTQQAARRGQGICIEHFEGDSQLKRIFSTTTSQPYSWSNVCTATMYLIGCRQQEHYRCGMAFGGRI
ncbi:uncharacterized protein LOC144907319 isoform X2 [Branchiostoma floridae x Branchiostoma belcheri]|nr:hypothetical protein Bbelb_163890 [Branchiostoma belcheri]